MIRRDYKLRVICFAALCLFSCMAPSTSMNTDGENIISVGNESECETGNCDPSSLDPIIDTAEPPTDQTDKNDNVNETEDALYPSESTEVCDADTDTDGDGVSCDCDENDTSATIYSVHESCDTDQDGIPDEYDACPEKNDSGKVTFIFLCDDVSETPAGITITVDYNEDKWTEKNCLKSTHSKMEPILPGENTRGLILINKNNFPIAYVFEDANENGKIDNCPLEGLEKLTTTPLTASELVPNFSPKMH